MIIRTIAAIAFAIVAAACSSSGVNSAAELQSAGSTGAVAGQPSPDYLIGPLDALEVFVWRAPELSTKITVRPDGRISTPLVEDMVAAGKTPTELSKDLKESLKRYVKDPQVTVIVSNFTSTFDQQVRVLGEAQKPLALPYQSGMTVLDVMVAVGGLTEFASSAAGRAPARHGPAQGRRRADRAQRCLRPRPRSRGAGQSGRCCAGRQYRGLRG